ncbi:MAG: nucleoside triphosphate pyrophosphohydrolase [Anaerolineales bacterium]|nr:nucleoside triphosphate pyrophosphohydrolase [Anaerolineales bacterium]
MNRKKSTSPTLTIVGLGPGDPDLLTRKAWEVISSSEDIYLRTKEHPTVDGFPPDLVVHSFDDYYQEENNIEIVYERITAEIIKLSQKDNGVVYAVPGDPFVAEATTPMILTRAREMGIDVVVIPGVSFLEPTLSTLKKDPLPQITILDALELQEAHYPPFPPDTPVLIAQVYSPAVASNLKLILMAVYPDDHPVYLIHDAGTKTELVENLPLFELDRSQNIGNRSSVYLPPLEHGSSLESFQEIIAHLRAPDGCPWDREQDHQSLRPNLLEEVFEVLEAIDADDSEAMQEEFGDLLLQIVLHAQIASEYGEFSMSDIIRGIYLKIIQRHPHVFEDLSIDQSREVMRNWEKIKAEERVNNGDGEKGLLDGVPNTMPALTQAQTYQKRAARIGFDWKDIEGVLKKIPEEIQEIKEAGESPQRVAEVGDLLFSVVNIARWLNIDAESALRSANRRFKERFSFIEKEARATGRELSEMDLDELDNLWEQSKSIDED